MKSVYPVSPVKKRVRLSLKKDKRDVHQNDLKKGKIDAKPTRPFMEELSKEEKWEFGVKETKHEEVGLEGETSEVDVKQKKFDGPVDQEDEERTNCDVIPESLPCIASLENVGNTCYLNSVLQILRYTPKFLEVLNRLCKRIEILEQMKTDDDVKEVNLSENFVWELTKSMSDIYKQMWNHEKKVQAMPSVSSVSMALRPYRILSIIRKLNCMFEGESQHDAHEFLQCILFHLQEAEKEIKKKENQISSCVSNLKVNNCIKNKMSPQSKLGNLLNGDAAMVPVINSDHTAACDLLTLVKSKPLQTNAKCSGMTKVGEGTMGLVSSSVHASCSADCSMDVCDTSSSYYLRCTEPVRLGTSSVSNGETSGAFLKTQVASYCRRLGIRSPLSKKHHLHPKSGDITDIKIGCVHNNGAFTDLDSTHGSGNPKSNFTSLNKAVLKRPSSNFVMHSREKQNDLSRRQPGEMLSKGCLLNRPSLNDIMNKDDWLCCGDANIKEAVVKLEKCDFICNSANTSVNAYLAMEVLDSSRGTKKKDFVEQLFLGTLLSRTRCLECENASEKHEEFLNVSVPLTKVKKYRDDGEEDSDCEENDEEESSLFQYMSSFSDIEKLQGDNKYFCDVCCSYVEAERSLHYHTLPEILTVHMKRFSASSEFGYMRKINDYLAVPLSLPCLYHKCPKPCFRPDHSYLLFGLITHIGMTLSSGHYISYAKTMASSLTWHNVMEGRTDPSERRQENHEESLWLECDDDSVRVFTEDDFLERLSSEGLITGTPYLLFYHRCSTRDFIHHLYQ